MQVIKYTRVSTKEQAKNDKTSLGNQSEVLDNYIKNKGFTVIESFTDAGFSGATINRPQLDKMFDFIKLNADKVDAVIVAYFDRWSRDTFMHLYLEKELMKYEVQLLSATEENLNGDDPATQMMRTFISAIAQYEKQRIVNRMSSGRARKAESGKVATGRTPFGYEKAEDGSLQVNPEQASIVSHIYELKAQDSNLSLNQIKKILKDQRGVSMSRSKIHYILNNKKYAGIVSQTVSGKKYEAENESLAII